MKKIAEVLAEINQIIEKKAFIPNPGMVPPDPSRGQPQDPSQGQGQPQGGQGGDISQIIAQLPPDMQQQIAQLPPEQQQKVLEQVLGAGGSGGGATPPGTDAGAEGEGAPGQGEQVQGNAAPTDLENSTVTLRLRDLLDLVSGGKATQSQLKVQDHIHKQHQRKQQMEQQNQQNQQKQQAKQQQDAMKQQQDAMANANGGTGGGGTSGGIY